MKSTTLTVLLATAIGTVGFAAPALAQSGYGFTWANQPGSQGYTPMSAYAYNSTGQAIRIRRAAAGRYSVTFDGLGGHGRAGGHVQVTAYGTDNHYCKIVSWNSGGPQFVVNVACFDAAGQPSDSRYTVQVSWPRSGQVLAPVMGEHGAPVHGAAGGSQEDVVVKRSVLDNGHVMLTYADGTIEERFRGGRIIKRSGQPELHMAEMEAIPPTPPTLPGTAEGAWLDYENARLLDTIRTLLGNDEDGMQNYFKLEQGKNNVYDQIATRTQTIQFLAQP